MREFVSGIKAGAAGDPPFALRGSKTFPEHSKLFVTALALAGAAVLHRDSLKEIHDQGFIRISRIVGKVPRLFA